MDDQAQAYETDLLELTSDIVSAFVSNNTVRSSELAELISNVHTCLSDVAKPKPVEQPAPAIGPAVSIKKSITDDYMICLDDGKKFKSLKRHLAALGMTPDEYRAKWGLPRDYPMVAPGYAAKRSELARASGLGNGRRVVTAEMQPAIEPEAEPEVASEPEEQPEAEIVAQPAKKTRGRPKKAA